MHRLHRASLPLFIIALTTIAALSTTGVVNNDEGARFGTHISVPGIEGALVIAGGGDLPDEVYEAFLVLAGGPQEARLVIVPTNSGRDADAEDVDHLLTKPWIERGVEHVTVLRAPSRAAAQGGAFARPLREATAVWFAGDGDAFIKTLRETAVHRALTAVLDRGGVIGATGPAAAALGGMMITQATNNAVKDALTSAFAFLPGTIIEHHASGRGRIDQLQAALCEHPGWFGLAVSEGTAVVVRGRRARVIGRSDVIICMNEGNRRDAMRRRFRSGSMLDLIALSRAAVARAGEPFPPDVCDAPVVKGGTLLIGGGGMMTNEMLARFIDAAGGPEAKIVVIPSALGGSSPRLGMGDQRRLQAAGARNVVIANAITPAEAGSPRVLEALRDAGGVWFSGGRQWRIVDAFADTTAHRLMHEVLARGGAIGGSSAGASIQAEYMVRGHPLGNTVMMAEGYERGLGFLPGVAIDQHFTQRGRLPDLAGVKTARPQLIGIGLDEGTVIIVSGSVAEVLGPNRVLIYDQSPGERDGEPSYTVLRAGDRYDLKARTIVE